MTIVGLVGYALLRVVIVAVPVFIAVEVIYFVRRWRKMFEFYITEEEFEEMEQAEREKHDEKVRELEKMSSSERPNK